MNEFEKSDYDILSLGEDGKIKVRVSCGGEIPTSIHVVEAGGRFIAAARYIDDLQANEFADRLSGAVQEAGLLTPYVENDSTRRRIQKIVRELDAQLRLDAEQDGPSIKI